MQTVQIFLFQNPVFSCLIFGLVVVLALIFCVLWQKEKTASTNLSLKYLQESNDQATQIQVLESQLLFSQQSIQALETQKAQREQELKDLDAQKEAIDKALSATQAQMQTLQQSWQDQQKTQDQLQHEMGQTFEQLAQKILEERGKTLIQQGQSSIDQVIQPLKEKLQSFQNRANEIHTESVRGQATLTQQIKDVQDMGIKMGHDAQALTQALKGNKKVLGNWGELQLETILQWSGLEKDVQYKTQQSFKTPDGQTLIPDVVVYLPDNKQLIIDSKVSLNAYQEAVNQSDEAMQQQALAQYQKDVKRHIDGLSEKQYANLPGIHSPGFVFMFMPIEAAFTQLLQSQQDLVHYAFDRHVVLVSPSTILPMLKTISYLWLLERSNQQALELGEKALEIYNQAATVSEHLFKLGQAINSVNKHFNASVTSFAGTRGLTGKLERFKSLSAKTSKEITEVQAVNQEADTQRLENVAQKP